MTVFKEEYARDVYNQNREHSISGVYQQKMKDDPDQDVSYAYISAESDFNAMPDELYVLLVSEREDKLYSYECPFDTILITGKRNTDVLERYCAKEAIGDDCLLHYRKYVKDKDVTGGLCIMYAQKENKVFYHLNPYFNVDTVSNDEDFVFRTSIPF